MTSALPSKSALAARQLPLSSAQQRLWFLDQFEQSVRPAYHMAGGLRLNGRLDEDALRRAMDGVIARHDALRTTFDEIDGVPVQLIAPHGRFAMQTVDLRAQPQEQLDAEVQHHVAAELQAPFDLRTGPLIRGRLLRLADERYLFIVAMHHIVSDGWSIAVLMQEFAALYAAHVAGQPSPLPALRAQYADHVRWERQRAALPTRAAKLDWWRRQLHGAPELLELPADRPRPAVPSHVGEQVELALPAALVESLRAWARRHDATLPMALHAGLAALLARLSGQLDVVIGMPVANRRRAELQPLIGFFVNTLALRTRLDGNPTAGALLDQVRAAAAAAYLRQDVPFEQVVEAVQPGRDPSHSPIFQVLLVLQNFETEPLALPQLQAEPVEFPPAAVPFDVTVYLRETRDGMVGRFAYARDLFDAATMRRWSGYFLRLLAAMARDDRLTLGELPLLDDSERQLLLERFNTVPALPDALHAPSAQDAPVHALFRAQAARTPDALALVAGEHRWRYAQLDADTDRLAQHLRRYGVGPDRCVALFVPRGPDMVRGMLAVLKAGGAYVPIDPADPPARTTRMLADAAPCAALTHGRWVAALPPALPVILLDAPMPEAGLADAPGIASEPAVAPQHPAYVIYTSGSTGAPKGVAMPHAALANLIRWQCAQGPALRTLQFAAPGFDVAFQEVMATLCAGGTLVIADEAARRDPGVLADLLREQSIERLFLPFIALLHLAQHLAAHPRPLPALREVITAGEQLRIGAELRQMFKRLPGCRLHNQYGPTETHVVTAHALDTRPEHWPTLPPIGRPVANTRAYVLDPWGRPAPVGVAGELHIGGIAVALGYWARADLTAERFRPDPFGAGPRARLYKTGDLARWRPDGLLEYLGRNDRQVKLRGFRIELAEIEAQLMLLPSVTDAAVVLRTDRPGEPRLVAYLVGGAAEAGRDELVRRQLRTALPPHMVPAAFVWLPALPVTTSGKVDHRALPPPAGVEAAQAPARVAPRNAIEQALWDIWREVLHTAAFGVDDSFFELGGHSLLMTQVASRVRDRLGVDLPLQALFEHATIAVLARRLAEAPDGHAASHAPAPIARIPRGRPLPVSLSQRRMWVIQQFDPASVAYNVPVSLRLRGPLDLGLVQRTLEQLVRRHEALRTRFALDGAEPVQIIEPALPVAIERADLRDRPAGERIAAARALLTARAAVPFDLAQAPLHRIALVQLDDDDHALLWLMHHTISDNWAMALLLREFLIIYGALADGGTPALPALPIEYADYAAWQRSAEAVAQRRHQLDHWVQRLRGLSPLNLPTDFARPLQPRFRGAKVSASLPPPLRDALGAFCAEHGVTPFMVLLAVFKLLLARQTGSDDIAVGSPIANRHHLATEHLVGTLVNTLVMRTDLSGDPSFAALVQRVRTTALEAYAHQDAPFDELVERLGQDRVAHPEGLVRVLFNVLNAPLGQLPPAPFRYEDFDLGRTAVQFDLSLHIDTEFAYRIHLEYSTEVYAPVTAARWLEDYLALVTQALAAPQQALSTFAAVAPAQVALLRHSWNATGAPLPPRPLVHRYLDLARPALAERPALVDAAGQWLSYCELETRSNALAHVLRQRGIGRGHRVGLCTARSGAMLVSLLSVLKSGAAYVPLDPGFPARRLAYMAGDAGLSAVLGAPAEAGFLAGSGVPLLDPAAPALTAHVPCTPLPADDALDARPMDPAYLIYTSGSTGQPKGVAVPHRAVVNFLASMAHTPGLQSADRLLAVTTLSFDIAVLELLLPLAVGAQVIIASREQAQDPLQLLALLDRHQATTMQATPSTWRALLDAGWTGAPGFRALVGGEPLPAVLAERLMAHGAALWNMYGPTETTVWSTCWPVQSPRDGILVGRPIANTSVWVLDPQGRPCAIGVPGEAFIGGAGVALGYHGRDDLTAERFVADPFSDAPNARLYRTGDRMRWRHDGQLEHLGRLDHQVKVRGFRIELGEIEAALLDHPAVAHCVVVTRAEREDDVRLVAYLVPRDGQDPGSALLREHLRQRLPDYMLPQHFVTLPALPLLPNGKIDRGALPTPRLAADAPRDSPWQPPRTDQEIAVATIWGELLGAQAIDCGDNFFDLGGHSLLAMRAVALMRERLGWQVEPARFIYETLGQLANPANLSPPQETAPPR